MKKFLLAVLMLALLSPLAFGAVAVQDDGTYVGEASTISFSDSTVTFDGTTATVEETDVERFIDFRPVSFTLDDGSAIALVATDSKPGLELENNIPALVWADTEATYAAATFEVPADYASGGSFEVLCDVTDATTTSALAFNVYVNGDGDTFDASAASQTTVALAEAAGTLENVALSISSDFASLAAGDVVTFRVARDDSSGGSADLELYLARFIYTAEG